MLLLFPKEDLLFFHSLFFLCSYCDLYTFCCNQYQSYSEGFPSNLHDRPWEFVLHCLERRKIALGSDLWRITSQEKDLFAVLNFTNNLSKCYKIYSWNKHEMPKQVICANIFLQFLKNFHHDQSMHYLKLLF